MQVIANLVSILLICWLGSLVYTAWRRHKTTKQYWPVLCHLSRCTTGANTHAVALALGQPEWIVLATLQRLHDEGCASFVQIPRSDPKMAFLYSITPQGREWVEKYRPQLEAAGLKPA